MHGRISGFSEMIPKVYFGRSYGVFVKNIHGMMGIIYMKKSESH